MEIEWHWGCRCRHAIGQVQAAIGLDVEDIRVSAVNLNQLELQVGSGHGRADSADGRETILQAENGAGGAAGRASGRHVVGDLGVSEDRVSLGHDGSNGVEAFAVALDVPEGAPRGEHALGVGGPGEGVGLDVHREEEVGVGAAGS